MRCLIKNCKSDMHSSDSPDQGENGFSTHRFPSNPDRRRKWWNILSSSGAVNERTLEEVGMYARICSRHFKPSDFRIEKGRSGLLKDAIPTLFLNEIEKDSCQFTSIVNACLDEPPQPSISQHKRLRYAGDVNLDNISPDQAVKALPIFHRQLASAQQRNNHLKQQNFRLRSKVSKLNGVLNELKHRKIISSKGEIILDVKSFSISTFIGYSNIFK
ncbi:THAP domain-containing protein 2-like [Wyeomyia smithii]|uniref:THAP domain-containing protein 2-like n=1 Tax=Wyeomyia smithii TaxID=174621 RepID=UPI002467EE60|nr:THAP domain-containing protein 2-like [Wyeomyia smithii]